MLTIFVLALSITAGAAVPENLEKIVGGIQTSINQYPYMTVLLLPLESSIYMHFCGGSIITKRNILTAAHCTDPDEIKELRLRVGSSYAHSGGVIYNAESITNHADHDRPQFDNDVSVIRTASPIVYSSIIQPAVIASATYIVPDNDVVWVTGWGFTKGSRSEELRHAQTWVINQSLCYQRYAELGHRVTNNMLCTGWLDIGGRGQCHGDSGGPIIHNGVVVGISSWVYECARPRYPNVNVRVSRYASWITAHSSQI